MNIADYILLIFIIVMLSFGISKGFFKMLIELVSSLLAFVLAVLFAKPIATVMQDIFIFDGMKKGISDFFTHNADMATKNVKQVIDGFALPGIIKEYLLKDLPDPAQTINDGASILADKVFFLMLLGIICIAMFILIRVGFYFIDVIVEKFFEKVKILDVINKVLGAFFGIANGLLIVYMVLAIVAIISSSIPSIVEKVISSSIVSSLYLNNLLIMLLT